MTILEPEVLSMPPTWTTRGSSLGNRIPFGEDRGKASRRRKTNCIRPKVKFQASILQEKHPRGGRQIIKHLKRSAF
nr:uncharacterized protein LOC102147128 isoform X3 [Macaca fascicularis]